MNLKESKVSIEKIRLFQSVIDQSPEAIFIVKSDGRILDTNSTAQSYLGYTSAQLKAMNITDIDLAFPSKEELGSSLEKIKQQEFISLEGVYKRIDNSTFPAEIKIIRHVQKNEELYIVFVKDISESRIGSDKLTNALREVKLQQVESESLNEILLNSSPDIIYIYDIVDKRNVYSNEVITDVLGYTVGEIQEMGDQVIPKLMHPDDLKKYQDKILQQYQEIKDGEWIEHEYRMRHKGGEWRWLYSKEAIFKRKENGIPHQIFGVIRDITNDISVKARLQDALDKAEENEHRFNELFRNMNNGCAIYKAINNGNDFIFVDFNKAGECIEKTKKKDILGKKVTEVFPGVVEFGLHDVFKRVYHTGKAEHFPVTFYKDDKIQGWRDNYVYKLKNGDVVAIYYDRTLEKQAELELIKAKEIAEENEQKYKRLTDNAPDLIYRMSLPDGEYKYVSPSSVNSFGYTPEEFYHSPKLIANAIHPDFVEYFRTEWKKLLAGDCSPTYEYKIISKGGKEKWMHQRNVLIRDGSNNPVAIEGIVTDITDRKTTEQALIESEKQLRIKNKEYEELNARLKQTNSELLSAKEEAEESNRLKTEFLNNMSHEIRTPMNGIIGFTDFLNTPELSLEKQHYYTRIIQNSAKQLLHIIDDILEISTLSTKQVKVDDDTFCLNDLLMELFSIFNLRAQQRKIPIYLKKGLTDKQCCLQTDKTKLSKILTNLIDNAIKYTQSGYIEMGYTFDKGTIQLYVKDTGIGIDTKNREVIFERFIQEEREITRKSGGLGLGLSIAKENAELIGATITLESQKGKGSTFYVTIPYPTAVQSVNRSNSGNHEGKKLPCYTVLVAEDEEINFLYIETILENIKDYKIQIAHAKNGQEAVDYCTENKNVDLVLMDIKMPVMNGHDATVRIKKINSSLPVVAQTAYSTPADRKQAMNAGCTDFITKPIDRVKLENILIKYLVVQNPDEKTVK